MMDFAALKEGLVADGYSDDTAYARIAHDVVLLANTKEQIFAEKLKSLLGTQVQIKTGRKKSKVEIEFYSEEDLERILGLIGQHRAASNQERIEKLRQFSQTGKFTV